MSASDLQASQIDLKPFCSTDPEREYLHSPFSYGEYTYATNGHLMVRVSRRADVPERENAPGAKAEKMIGALDLAQSFAPLAPSTFPDPEMIECVHCDGRGTVHECPDCACVCDFCQGKTEVLDDKYKSISIDGVYFNLSYARTILSLPEVELPAKIKEGGPVPYRFAEGIGIWMQRICAEAINVVVRP